MYADEVRLLLRVLLRLLHPAPPALVHRRPPSPAPSTVDAASRLGTEYLVDGADVVARAGVAADGPTGAGGRSDLDRGVAGAATRPGLRWVVRVEVVR